MVIKASLINKLIVGIIALALIGAGLVLSGDAFVGARIGLYGIAIALVYYLTKNINESRQSEERMRKIIDNMPLATHMRDGKFNMIDCNEAARILFGLPDKQTYIKKFEDCMPQFQPDGQSSKEAAIKNMHEVMKNGYKRLEWTYLSQDGELIPCEVALLRVEWRGSEHLITFIQDRRFFHKYKEVERIARQRLDVMLDSSPVACVVADEKFNIIDVNKELLRLFEISDPMEYVNRFFDFMPKLQPDGWVSKEKLLELLGSAQQDGAVAFEFVLKSQSGTEIPSKVNMVKVMLDGKAIILGYILDLRDIRNAFDMVAKFSTMAYADELTGISSRRHFIEASEAQLKNAVMNGTDLSIIYFDVDDFKKVNDSYGHAVGDEVLKIVTGRAKNAIKKDTLVSRYGGEEFTIMLPGTGNEHAVKTAERIRQSINSSNFAIGNLSLPITISFGVASKTEFALTLSEIIDNADKALYQAKNSGKNMVVSYEDLPASASPRA